MSRLKVTLRGALISEFELKQDKEYVGGRKDGCDIKLQPEKGISREHFKLKFSDSKWTLQAISRFGDVFSLGQKIESVPLDHGQSFQIPPYEFQFLDVPESELSSVKASPVSEYEKTVVGVSPQVPYIKIINSSGAVSEMLRLEVGEIWVAGRDPSCQIIIPDQRVSRRQFEIHKVNGTYTIIDLDSVNGTFLNGSPVSSTDPMTLKSGDAITVLDNTLYFELHDPNFKYKVDKIEIPPIRYDEVDQGDQFEEQQISKLGAIPPIEATRTQNLQSDPNRLPSEIPIISQDQVNPQLDIPGAGPFTGIPPQAENNQFFSFSPPPENHTAETKWQKIKKNKPLLAVLTLAFLVTMYFVSEFLGNDSTTNTLVKTDDPTDPLAKLPPEQRTQVKEYYTLAEQMMEQSKWDLAIEKLNKINELVKEGYKDSNELLKKAEQSLKVKEQEHQDAERMRMQEEDARKVAEIKEKCQKIIGPNLTVEQMQECLIPMAQINLDAPEYLDLMNQAEKIQKDREIKIAAEKAQEQEQEDLASMFKKAESTQQAGYAYKAIKQYNQVINSKINDPKKLKEKAKKRIAYIEQKISEKTTKSVSLADSFLQEGKLKLAVQSLRESLVYDPENKKVKEKIDSYKEELRRQAKAIYQESIIDESYGLVESTETKQGAKDKWKKILEIDIDDGEYYKKAVIKLRRYGIL